MTLDISASIAQFLEASAAKSPTPGGGAVAAMAGALSASMGEMVLNYSVGKKSLAAFESELRPALAAFNEARKRSEKLLVEDQKAYLNLTEIKKKKEQGTATQQQVDEALHEAIRVPSEISAVGIMILETADRVIGFVNPYLLSDLAVCADLAMTTVRCGTYNVRVNLSDIQDPAVRRARESELSQVLSRAAKLIQQVSPRIWERQALGT